MLTKVRSAWLQAWTLLLLGPFLDRYISHGWVFNYDWNVPALTFLALSCACAVGVNVSQFMCLGRFSAVSYQVWHTTAVIVNASSMFETDVGTFEAPYLPSTQYRVVILSHWGSKRMHAFCCDIPLRPASQLPTAWVSATLLHGRHPSVLLSSQ